jgi:hypothetical protein
MQEEASASLPPFWGIPLSGRPKIKGGSQLSFFALTLPKQREEKKRDATIKTT